MTDAFVRVRTANGYEASVSAAYVEGITGDVEVIDAPATNTWGRPLAATRRNGRTAKQRTTVSKAAAAKKAASTTTTGGTAADSPEEGTE